MRRLNSKKGVTLLELIIAGIIASFVFGSFFYVTGKVSSSGEKVLAVQNSQQQGFELASYLLNFGRMAEEGTVERPCSRTSLPSGLICEIQLSTKYGDGTISSLTFLNDSNTGNVLVEESKSGGAWTTKVSYAPPAVRGLEICGDTEMIAGTCAIRVDSATRDKLEIEYSKNPNSRFFRFRVRLAASVGAAAAAPDRYITGAFYARNPFPNLVVTDPGLASLKATRQQR